MILRLIVVFTLMIIQCPLSRVFICLKMNEMPYFEDIQLRQVLFHRQEKKIVNLDSKEEFTVDRIRLNVHDQKPSTNQMK